MATKNMGSMRRGSDQMIEELRQAFSSMGNANATVNRQSGGAARASQSSAPTSTPGAIRANPNQISAQLPPMYQGADGNWIDNRADRSGWYAPGGPLYQPPSGSQQAAGILQRIFPTTPRQGGSMRAPINTAPRSFFPQSTAPVAAPGIRPTPPAPTPRNFGPGWGGMQTNPWIAQLLEAYMQRMQGNQNPRSFIDFISGQRTPGMLNRNQNPGQPQWRYL